MVVLAVPLTLAAIALLIISLRAAGRRLTDDEYEAADGRALATALATPPSEDGLGELRRLDLRRSVLRAMDPDVDLPARRMAAPRRGSSPQVRDHFDPAAVADDPLAVGRRSAGETQALGLAVPAPFDEGPLPAGVPTKDCPDCAETVLEAARICKHCRYRFDGEQDVIGPPAERRRAAS